MALELGPLEVAAQQVTGAKLADAKLFWRAGLIERGRGAKLLAPYLQSSAPLRHT